MSISEGWDVKVVVVVGEGAVATERVMPWTTKDRVNELIIGTHTHQTISLEGS